MLKRISSTAEVNVDVNSAVLARDRLDRWNIIRGLIKNIRGRIYCRKTKASTSYSKLSPSKYDPSDCMQRFQQCMSGRLVWE
jgi:hypothetical protein